MFGKNEVTSNLPHRSDGSLLVHEIFPTIQGEGPDAGRPAVFVRLAKCNLRCWFCDTEFEQGSYATPVEILFSIGKARPLPDLVVITGGEPMLQNICPLVELINDNGMSASVETAGTVYVPGIEDYFATDRSIEKNLMVCSPKTPLINTRLLPCIGAWKYIVKDGEQSPVDGLPIRGTQRRGQLSSLYHPSRHSEEHAAPIYLQPCDEGDDLANHANRALATKLAIQHGYRLSIQIHKLVGLP